MLEFIFLHWNVILHRWTQHVWQWENDDSRWSKFDIIFATLSASCASQERYTKNILLPFLPHSWKCFNSVNVIKILMQAYATIFLIYKYALHTTTILQSDSSNIDLCSQLNKTYSKFFFLALLHYFILAIWSRVHKMKIKLWRSMIVC